MAGIAQLLSYLERDDVTEIILQTGKAVTARVAGQLRPLGVAPVSGPQIAAILADPMLADLRQTGQPEPLVVGDRNLLATVMRRGDVVMVRVAKPADAAPAPDVRATPTYASRGVEPPIVPQETRPRVPTVRPLAAAPETPRAPAAAASGRGSMFGSSFPAPDAPPPPPPVENVDIMAAPAETRGAPGGMSTDRMSFPAPNPVAAPNPFAAPPSSFAAPAPLAVPNPFASPASFAAPTPVAVPIPFAAPTPVAVPTRAPSFAAPAAAATPAVPSHAPSEPPPSPTAAVSIEDLRSIQPWTPGSFRPTFDPFMLQLFQQARQQAASDLHVVAARPAQVRLVGELRAMGEPLDPAQVEAMLLPLLDPRSLEQLHKLGYADLAFEVPGAGRMRANVNRQKTGLKGCFRLILAEPPTLDELGLPEELSKVTNYHQGLAIVSGPTGHGKTTTMAALVDLVNSSKQAHIITVEDPVEIIHPMKKAVISQRQVGAHTNTFKAALKGALREDPDVIVIGELRDVETVEMALSAAETGHLVIATMSTPSGAKTIDRLIDMFPPEDQSQVRATLAGALKIIISQRLLPTADGTRMVAAAELITGSFPLWNMIRDDKLYQLPSLVQRGRSFGMIRIEDSLRKLVEDGVITMAAATRVAGDPRALQPPAAAVAGGFRPKGAKDVTPAPEEKKPAVRPPYGKGS